MASDYESWRRERLAELDAIDAQINKLPYLIGREVREYANSCRNLVHDLNANGFRHESGRWVDKGVKQLSAELNRITVAPVPDA